MISKPYLLVDKDINIIFISVLVLNFFNFQIKDCFNLDIFSQIHVGKMVAVGAFTKTDKTCY